MGNDIFPNEKFRSDMQISSDADGVAIPFTMELPWIDGRTPMRTKQLRFISIDSRGTAPFTVGARVEFKAATDITANFVGNDSTLPLSPSAVKSNDPQLYGFPLKFKTTKLTITGTSKESLTIASIRLLFSRGQYRR